VADHGAVTDHEAVANQEAVADHGHSPFTPVGQCLTTEQWLATG